MHKRKVLCLRPRDAEYPAMTALASEWDIHFAPLETPPPLDYYQVGLILLRPVGAEIERAERLLASARLEWIAVIPPGGLADPDLARLVLRHCADYHTLPVETHRLGVALGHAYGMRVLRRVIDRGTAAVPMHGLVGVSEPIRKLVASLRKVAAVAAPVLIQGESGTGKELAAHAIHDSSPRAKGPFVAVNCGAIPGSLIQSELFGHERGAFTGAQRRKIGRIEAADGGTILLDEIGDLSLELQVNLLRFLQEGVIERVGGSGPVPVNVRVVAATHVDLEAAVAARRFRSDLYYRLNVLRLEMPPLRRRSEDIEPLAMYFFHRFAAEKAPHVRGFSRHAIDALLQHSWPGNVRELLNRVRRAMVMCEGRLIGPNDLVLLAGETGLGTLAEARAEAERTAVRQALVASRHNISQAAGTLGVSRVTLYRLMDKYGIGGPTETAKDDRWRPGIVATA